ncbi:MAG TPA: hypothetical protein VGE16_09175, partial [Albitalea sp.]
LMELARSEGHAKRGGGQGSPAPEQADPAKKRRRRRRKPAGAERRDDEGAAQAAPVVPAQDN